MQDFKQLAVWKKGHQLTLAIYKATEAFPKDELYGLTSQTCRAAASIPTNIAEGCGRSGKAELARFLSISMGSASELEYHLLLGRDLGFLRDLDYGRPRSQVTEIKKMLASLIKRLRTEN